MLLQNDDNMIATCCELLPAAYMLANIVAIYAIGGCTYPPMKVETNSPHKDVWHRVEKVSHAKS